MGKRKKRSIIWTISSKDFSNIVERAKSYADILRHFGFNNQGGNFKTVKARINKENLDISHFSTPREHGLRKKTPLKDILKEGTSYKSARLKKRLVNAGLLEDVCVLCGQSPSWENKPLVLVLDHINGKSDDNRIENLRILCPNCHSQTDTFCGRNRKLINNCKKCGIVISRTASHCKKCLPRKTKISWPPVDVLISQINATSKSAVAKNLGVSEAAVRKFLKKHNGP